MNSLIEINNIKKVYNLSGNNHLEVINNLSFKAQQNSNISIIGPSGSGKSTFLNIIGLLDLDYSGSYLFNGKEVKNFQSNKINHLRGLSIGFVHQFFHLIPELSVLENVMLPSLINNKKFEDSENNALKLIETFGLKERSNFKPIKLSGGEQQRVAISRALVNNPELILADEMTGNLDENTADEIFSFLLNYIKENNKCFIYVTHNKKYSKIANEQYYFKDRLLLKIND